MNQHNVSLRKLCDGVGLYLLDVRVLDSRQWLLLLQVVELLQPPVALLQLLENSVLLGRVLVGPMGLYDVLSIP